MAGSSTTGSNQAQYGRTYNSFSGIDITAVFAGKAIAECQGISYSVSREKAPLYTLGSPNPRSFSRGKRGIAGAVVFLVFDRSALFQGLQDEAKFWANTNEAPINKLVDIVNFNGLQPTTVTSAEAESLGSVYNTAGGTAGSFNPMPDPGKGSVSNKRVMNAWYHDQIPPFDIMLVAVTERGHGAVLEILGAEILNCGSGISVDDVTTDESCTWIGKGIIPWHSQTYRNPANVTDVGQNGGYVLDGSQERA